MTTAELTNSTSDAGFHWNRILQNMRVNQSDLSNFRKDPTLWYLDNSNPTRRGSRETELRAILAYEAIVPLLSNSTKPFIVEATKGNPHAFLIDGKQVTYASIEYAYMAETILQNLKISPKVIVEIGAGFGGLAKMLVKLWPNVEYHIIDFSEVLRIQKFYLEDIDNFQYHEIDEEVDLEVDLWINSRSMMEMLPVEQQRYLQLIRKTLITKGSFYCLNVLDRTSELSLLDDWNRVVDRPWILQPIIQEIVFEKEN